MRYLSTRGGVPPLAFGDAVLMGLGSDGGLLLPETYPTVSPDTLRQWAKLPFQALALQVMAPFTDLPAPVLSELIRRSYAGFSHPEITPLRAVGRQMILELFHGPTLAFKDVALQFLGNLFEYLLEQRGGQLNILGATSGDTGSAAIHGVRGKARINIFILFPAGRVSPVQERQMTTVLDPNVHTMALRGDFDHAQAIVKELFNDLAFKEEHHLGAVNSINWARILAQVVYYFYAWGQASGGDPDHAVTFSVPTGNFGDIFAAWVARRMGLPVRKLILATNHNAILTRFVQTGEYRAGEVKPSLSPSMDIMVSSNFERYLYHLLGDDPASVRHLMERFTRTGALSVTPQQHHLVQSCFAARAVSEEETLEQIRRIHHDHGYVLDPHTAVGVAAAQGHDLPICLATAHPAKFGSAVAQAIGREIPLPAAMADLMSRPSRRVELDARADTVKAHMLATLAAV
ncbi:MAG: threonine synthase [Magnetococcus sp. WYHC-3]